MCKQEDYFKNWSTCTTKNIFPCHASTWRPKPCRALGWGTTERSRFTSLTENSGSNQQSASEAKQKSYPDAVLRWEAFFPQKVKFGWSFLNFFSLFVLVGGRGRKRGVSDRRKKKISGRRSQLLKCTLSKLPQNYNIQSIPSAHWSCQQRVKMLRVHVAIKKTNPPCAVLRKYSGGLMRSRGFSSCC